MPIPKNKKELIEAIDDSYSKLKNELSTLPKNRVNDFTLPGHAKDTWMSLHNLISYLVGWTDLVLKWERLSQRNEEVEFPEKGFKWNQLGLLAKKFYTDYHDLTFDELLFELQKNTDEIYTLINSKSNSQLYETKFYGQYPLGRMIQLNTSSPFKNALKRIRSWKKNEL